MSKPVKNDARALIHLMGRRAAGVEGYERRRHVHHFVKSAPPPQGAGMRFGSGSCQGPDARATHVFTHLPDSHADLGPRWRTAFSTAPAKRKTEARADTLRHQEVSLCSHQNSEMGCLRRGRFGIWPTHTANPTPVNIGMQSTLCHGNTSQDMRRGMGKGLPPPNDRDTSCSQISVPMPVVG